MRKWFAILLSLLMLFSLAACGEDSGGSGGGSGGTEPPEGYDAEYTVVIDGSDSWTPFEDGSGVTFVSGDGGVISTSDDGKTVTFTGLAVGETTITASSGDQTAKALVKVVKRSASESDGGGDDDAEFTGVYRYDPPTDNFCIEIKYTENGENHTNTYGKIGSEEAGIYGQSDWQEFCNVSTGSYYTVVDGKWYEDVNWGFDTFEELGHHEPITSFNEFVELLKQMGFGNEKISDFYIGTETVCGIDCWIFDTDGWNGQYAKYWVDPANGCALKKAGTTTDTVYEVTKYDLDYITWDAVFVPN